MNSALEDSEESGTAEWIVTDFKRIYGDHFPENVLMNANQEVPLNHASLPGVSCYGKMEEVEKWHKKGESLHEVVCRLWERKRSLMMETACPKEGAVLFDAESLKKIHALPCHLPVEKELVGAKAESWADSPSPSHQSTTKKIAEASLEDPMTLEKLWQEIMEDLCLVTNPEGEDGGGVSLPHPITMPEVLSPGLDLDSLMDPCLFTWCQRPRSTLSTEDTSSRREMILGSVYQRY